MLTMIDVRMLKTLSHLTSVGLLGGMGVGLYDFLETGQHETHFDRARAAAVLNGVGEPAPPTINALSYEDDIKRAIVEFDWTGALPQAPTTSGGCGGPIVEPTPPGIHEILQVVFTMASSDAPSDSCCLVRLLDSTGARTLDLWLYIGDSLPEPNADISLLDVQSNHVTFSFADSSRLAESVGLRSDLGKSEIPLADKVGIANGSSSLVPSEEFLTSDARPLKTLERNGQFYIGTEDAEHLSENYAALLATNLTSETHYGRDGMRDGIKITKVVKDSFAAQYGLRTGDIVKSINGHTVNSQQEAIAFAKQNGDRYSIWQVAIENLGRTRIEVYHSPGN